MTNGKALHFKLRATEPFISPSSGASDATIQCMKPRKSAAPAKREKPPRRGKKKQPVIAHEGKHAAELVIITGMSGSGKASVLKAFEDLGYYCEDNRPVQLIPRIAEKA
jgi:hypothetical protein